MIQVTLVLDNLRSCHNVGSIIRTANGFGHKQFVFLGTTPFPLIAHDHRLAYQGLRQTRQIAKTALGAEKEVQGKYYKEITNFLKNQETKPLVCLEQTAKSRPLHQYKPKQDCYLVLGSETEGVSSRLLEASTNCLQVEMRGKKESFNVAVMAGLALYQFSLPS